MAWYRREPSGIALSVRVTPKGGRNAIDGGVKLADGREVLAIRVRAAPEKGAANAAVVGLLAASLGVAKSAVRVESGTGGRLKQLRVTGEPEALAAAVAKWTKPS